VRDSAEALKGCDTCGAQLRRDDSACPICGALQARRPGKPAIPVRRFGEVPPYPEEDEELLADDSPEPRRRPLNAWPWLLAAGSTGLLAACARYLLH
jgi:hypothetical protein